MSDIPAASRERLLRLLKYLETTAGPAQGKMASDAKAGAISSGTITSTDIAALTFWPRDTVRKDISCLEGFEGSTAGYDCGQLAGAIRQALGLERELKFCIVGLGRLGSSLLNNSFHAPYKLIAGFDSNVNRVEILKSPVPLYPAYKMGDVIRRFGIEACLLCVPEDAAQVVADKLVAADVKGIVNFSPAALKLPTGVSIRNVDLRDELRALLADMAHTAHANEKFNG